MVLSIVAAALFAAGAAPEPASPPATISVQWGAPAQCPQRAALVERVARLAEVRVVESEAQLSVVASIEPAEVGFVADIVMGTEAGEQRRQLEAADCQVLSQAVAIVVAVALDPVQVAVRVEPVAEATASVPEPEREPEPKPEPEPEPEPDTQPEPAPSRVVAPARREPLPPRDGPILPGVEAGVGLGLLVAGRILPSAGAGIELVPFVGIPRVHVRMPLQVRPSRRATIPGNAGAGAVFTLVAGGLRACPQLRPEARVRIPLCGGVDFGAVVAEPRGGSVRSPRSATSFWSAVAAEVGIEVGLASRWSAYAGIEAAVSLSRPRFVLDGAGEPLHETARFGPRGTLGVRFHRPRGFL